jgi:HTH-type transcriptional regulator/antitoxin HipB
MPFPIATPQDLGAAIRAARQQLGLRQDDVALAAGVGIRFVSELERGKPTAQIGAALRVAASLGLQITAEPTNG